MYLFELHQEQNLALLILFVLDTKSIDQSTSNGRLNSTGWMKYQ